jgi:radical SAM superfamily enzyme YgiQ (UPF0313 family)
MGGIFPTTVPEEAAAHADAIVLGEGEGVWSEVLCDAAAKQLKPVYREREPLDLSKSSLPRIDLYVHKEGRLFSPDDYPVQLSRGCPLTCSACAIPATAGRRLRHFPLQHVLGQIDQIETRGKLASFTEDTSFFFGSGTQRRFGVLLDALAERGRPAAVSYIGVSVPMILATPDAFFARLRAAGISMFYLVGGFDPITRNAFTGKDPKSYDRAVDAIRRSRDYGIEPYTSFLVGNEDDNEGTFDRMLGWADKAKLSKAEFAIMTPYPGTPVWAQLVRQERVLTKNWSLYNDANVVFRPKHLTPEQLLSGYLYLWREFYRPRREAIREMSRNDRTIQF